MTKTKDPDWNPRTLSTFSTFGGGNPTIDGVNGKRFADGDPVYANLNGQDLLKINPETSAEKEFNGHYNVLQDHMPLNESKPISGTVNGHAIPAALPRSNPSPIIYTKYSPGSISRNRIFIPVQNESQDIKSNLSPTMSIQNRPDVVPPLYDIHQQNMMKDGQGSAKIKGTKVPPPILPRHAYSKSLVGEEMTSVVPCHGHSRSMSGGGQLDPKSTPNFQDGVGDVTVFLGPMDRRFGFSVIGGCDEIYPPKIDEIAKGSPADKADLEVGDEILEVNGRSLEDATHTEVISHIHQCIRSRTICLRVKRRTGNKLAADLAASSNVQDAFVIAVEQRARERLERLSALKKIKPVDMTKLSSQLSEPVSSQCNRITSEISTSDDVNGVLETSPIYVTSVPNLTSSSASVQRSSIKSRSSTPGVISTSSPQHRPKSPPSSVAKQDPLLVSASSAEAHSSDSSLGRKSKGPTPPVAQPRGQTPSSGSLECELDGGNKSGDELELTHDLDHDDRGYAISGDSRSEDDLEEEISESGDSLPATPEKSYGLGSASSSQARREVLLDSKCHLTDRTERPKTPLENSPSLESKDSASSRKSGGSASSNASTGPSKVVASSRRSSGYPEKGPRGDNGVFEATDNMMPMVEFDPADKEMAVDVPDTFIGRTKTPPRYPPPKPQGTTGGYAHPVSYNNNNYSSSCSSKSSSKRGASLSSGTVTPVNGSLSKPVSPPVVSGVQMQQDVVVYSPNSQEENMRLKRYEEELKNRREKESEDAELQRSSIRGSQKLQALVSHPQGEVPPSSSQQPQATGMVNQAFEDTDGKLDKDSSPSINELINSLKRIQEVLKSNGHRLSEDMTVVAHLLVNPEFQKVLAVHNKVQETWCLNRPPTPFAFNAQQLAAECMEVLNRSSSPDALELVQFLNSPPVEGLFYSHDRIADSEPRFDQTNLIEHSVDAAPPPEKPVPMVTNYPNDNVQIVRIDKTNEPLGATIRNEGDSVIVGRIVQGGAAEKSGRLHEGDEILEVNGVDVRGKSVNDVCDMLSGMTGTLTFMVVPWRSPTSTAPTQRPSIHAMHVKAFFDYDPEEDLYIPCRELGMSFQKGDILHVMNQEDSNWWQAYRDGEEDQSLAGLIPSKSFQQQREAMRQTVVGESNSKEKSKKGKLLCAKKHHKKKKKKMLYPNNNEDHDTEEILTYEEVALYFPVDRKRPIVLIGPPNIGRHELRQKLMEDTNKFAAAVPHTSRTKKEHELDGQDYHFISRAQFEADILARKFVEHGEFEKAYYGTSLDGIRTVVNSGKICLLNLHTVSLKMLKNSDLMPYVVLIAPPSLEKLRQRKQKLGEPFKEEDLKDTIQKAREMEDEFGHYFDLVLINQDIERTYQQLIHEINILEREPQWVPAAWLAKDR